MADYAFKEPLVKHTDSDDRLQINGHIRDIENGYDIEHPQNHCKNDKKLRIFFILCIMSYMVILVCFSSDMLKTHDNCATLIQNWDTSRIWK